MVVNDGSTDKTNDIVSDDVYPQIPTLQLLNYEQNNGKGFVVVRMLKAKGQYRLFTDADNATSIDHLEK